MEELQKEIEKLRHEIEVMTEANRYFRDEIRALVDKIEADIKNQSK